MLKHLAAATLIAAFSFAEAAPTLSHLSETSVTRSGRVVVFGSGFGNRKGSSRLRIGGVAALTTRWTDGRIVAYVPERAALGPSSVQLIKATEASNTLPMNVTLRTAVGRVNWKFRVDSDYVVHRPAVGPKGQIVVQDSGAFAYCLTPTGALKWITRTPGGDGPPSIGADGVTYLGAGNSIFAINPDGTRKWVFTEPGDGQGLIAGPTVGPDGNIYAISGIFGLGAFSLTPSGQLRWSNNGDPVMEQYGQMGVEIVFGPGVPGGTPDRFYAVFDDYTTAVTSHAYAFSFDGNQLWARPGGSKDMFMMRQNLPAVGPDGRLFVCGRTSGGANWSVTPFSPEDGAYGVSFYPFPGNGMSPPDVGKDGTVYFSQSLAYLHAVGANGRQKWQFFDGSLIQDPIVSPLGNIVCAGGLPEFGVPGFIRGFSTKQGNLLWNVAMGVVNGGNEVPYTRPRFSADGSALYIGSAVLGPAPGDEFCHLFSVKTN